MPVTFHLIRHGETLLNLLKRNQGWIDSDLTNEGVLALETKYRNSELPLMDAIYCSDLGRAKGTLDVVIQEQPHLSAVPVTYSKDLRERFLGGFEGKDLLGTREKLAKLEGFDDFADLMDKESFWYFVDSTAKYDDLNLAENFSEFSSRVDQFMSEIIDLARIEGQSDILIVTHANTLKYIAEQLLDGVFNEEINNGDLFSIVID